MKREARVLVKGVSESWARTVCLRGSEDPEKTCAFSVGDKKTGYGCAQHSSIDGMIMRLLKAGELQAKGHNCSGSPKFKSTIAISKDSFPNTPR